MNCEDLIRRLAEERRVQSLEGRAEALIKVRQAQITMEGLSLSGEKCFKLAAAQDEKVIHPYIAKMNALAKK